MVRNVYAFDFDSEKIKPLIEHLRPVFTQINIELLRFADLLEQIGESDLES